MYIMMTFLEVNGIKLNCSNDDVYQTGMAVASGEIGYEELRKWIVDHS